MRNLFTLSTFIVCLSAAAQESADSIPELNTVTVSGITRQVVRNTPFNVSLLSLRSMQKRVNYNLCDALTKIAGVNQITTGNGISKPVIRGLYGNRIQTVLLGLKFDNQQWQDEHGLGLSIIGIDRVEVLKGPSSLLYGTEAMGGIINIIEEPEARPGTKEADVHVTLYSNTLGFSLEGGMKKNTGHKYWRLRFGADSHADYSDGNNDRVLNSRFESYNFKASLGYKKKNWLNQNHFYSSFSRFGFIMNDNQDRKPVDSRISRKLDGPYHAVLFNVLSSENTIAMQGSKLQLNGGIHSNLRMEDEGGNHISLNMFLNTISYNAKWFKNIVDGMELILGQEMQYQSNVNYGSRVIIPDAHLFETSFSAYIRKQWDIVNFETGLSVSGRNVTTKQTKNMDYSSGAIYPFSSWYSSLNGNAGIAINPDRHWNIKVNASTGYRSPNLAELSSNGLHEGTFRYEIGDPQLEAEQNLNPEVNINYTSNFIDFYSAAYINLFRNYVYLSPTGTQLYGFDVFRYLQGNAKLYGGELILHVRPMPFWAIESSFSTVTGKLVSGKYLPFIPADKLVTDLVIKFTGSIHWKTGADFFFEQLHPGDFETATDSYWLLHTSLQWVLRNPRNEIRLILSGENLLNKTYYDHLSRFKYFGIYNIGRNITASVHIPFNKK